MNCRSKLSYLFVAAIISICSTGVFAQTQIIYGVKLTLSGLADTTNFGSMKYTQTGLRMLNTAMDRNVDDAIPANEILVCIVSSDQFRIAVIDKNTKTVLKTLAVAAAQESILVKTKKTFVVNLAVQDTGGSEHRLTGGFLTLNGSGTLSKSGSVVSFKAAITGIIYVTDPDAGSITGLVTSGSLSSTGLLATIPVP